MKDGLIIKGGSTLSGSVMVAGSKNAALPVLMAVLLSEKPVLIKNFPDELTDVTRSLKILELFGVEVKRLHNEISLDPSHISLNTIPIDDMKAIRTSVLLLGPCLGRFGRIKICKPGGCQIGPRPIDFHLSGLEKMGAKFEFHGDFIEASTLRRLQGAEIRLPKPSVTATANLIMAGCLAEGRTIIHNAALEPEIHNLCQFLQTGGATIYGIGTNRICIEGKDLPLHGGEHRLIGDRIEAGTFLIGALLTEGELFIEGIMPDQMEATTTLLKKSGAIIESSAHGILLRKTSRRSLIAQNISTAPFPGFSTDIQAPFGLLNALAKGRSRITETIFPNRFHHVPWLKKMGAEIELIGNTLYCKGDSLLTGTPVEGKEIRGSATLFLAGLIASGETNFTGLKFLERGYCNFLKKITSLGGILKLPV